MSRITDNTFESVWPIAREFADLWDIKTTLSAGVVVLALVNSELRERALKIVRGKEPLPSEFSKKNYMPNPSSEERLQEVKSIIRSLPENTIKILGEKDSKILADLRKAIGPEGEAQAAQQHHKIAAKASARLKRKQCQHDSSISA